jgi:hypothetical protein
MIALNIFSFPALVFFVHNIQAGWRVWYRAWRNDLTRFGGWIVMRKWVSRFNRDTFLTRLQNAQAHLRMRAPATLFDKKSVL